MRVVARGATELPWRRNRSTLRQAARTVQEQQNPSHSVSARFHRNPDGALGR
jgi:predicted nucleic acid-binding Zn ribbon protein